MGSSNSEATLKYITTASPFMEELSMPGTIVTITTTTANGIREYMKSPGV